MGRTTKRTPELEAIAFDALARTGSALKAAKEVGVSRQTLMHWCDDSPAFAEQYARSKQLGIDALIEGTIELADADIPQLANGAIDTGVVAQRKMQIATRQWYAERLAPKKYGVLIKNEVTGADGAPVAFTRIERVIVRADDKPKNSDG